MYPFAGRPVSCGSLVAAWRTFKAKSSQGEIRHDSPDLTAAKKVAQPLLSIVLIWLARCIVVRYMESAFFICTFTFICATWTLDVIMLEA